MGLTNNIMNIFICAIVIGSVSKTENEKQKIFYMSDILKAFDFDLFCNIFGMCLLSCLSHSMFQRKKNNRCTIQKERYIIWHS